MQWIINKKVFSEYFPNKYQLFCSQEAYSHKHLLSEIPNQSQTHHVLKSLISIYKFCLKSSTLCTWSCKDSKLYNYFQILKNVIIFVSIFKFISMEEKYILLQVYPGDLVIRNSAFLICKESLKIKMVKRIMSMECKR